MFIFPKIKILVLSAVALVAATVSGYAQQDTTRVVPAVDSLVKAQLPDSLKAAQPVDSLAAAKAADSLATVVPVVVPVSEGMPGQAGHDAKADAKSQTGQNGKAQQPDKQQAAGTQKDVKAQAQQQDKQKDAKGQAQKSDKQKAAKEAAQPQQADIQTVRPVVDTLAKLPTLDTLARRPWVGIYAIWPHRRTLATEQIDTLYIRTPEEIRDSLRREAPAIGFNLAWAGIATPNLGAEFPVSENLTLGISAGLKPGPNGGSLYWPRWSPFDKDTDNPTKWSHLAVIPYIRWWPNEVFRGFFLEGDLMFAHYNIAAIKLPFGIYPNIADYRLQGDFYGAGLSIGCSIWLTRHINLVLAAGALGGYKNATKYECPWCGGEVGTVQGVTVAPRLDVSVAYHLFNQKRHEKLERKKAARQLKD